MKNSLFNRIFRKDLLKKYESVKIRVQNFESLCESIESSERLLYLLSMHKQAWAEGYQNENLSPCIYGKFRTDSIPNMIPDEVFLGNIYGLFTHSLSYWNNVTDTIGPNGFGINPDTPIKSLIVKQYKRHLLRNIRNIHQQDIQFLKKYE